VTLDHLETTRATTDVVNRFIDAFQKKDRSAIPDLVAEDCVMEAMQPAPNGERVEGYDANVRFRLAMVSDPVGAFELEEVAVFGDRAINRWRYRFGEGDDHSVRGVTLIKVRATRLWKRWPMRRPRRKAIWARTASDQQSVRPNDDQTTKREPRP
jgi:ketosteroid isomerase-like protein